MNNQKITPCLWLEKDAKAAAEYYLSIFKDGKLKDYRLFENMPNADGSGNDSSFETAVMELAGVEFSILAAGPMFKFNEAISLVINCKDQDEVDYYWEALTSNGGEEGPCGWCKDKYGLSWQVVPVRVFELLSDPATSDRVMAAVMEMKKIELSKIEQAAAKKAGA